MAIEKFWGSVRTAMELYEPPYPQVPRTTAWLNRHAVDGFDPRDFDFLADDERERLETSVATVRKAATKVTPPQPPTAAQLEEGAEALRALLHILDPKRNFSPEFFRITKILDAELEGKLSHHVENLVYEPTIDSEGDPAIKVVVVFSVEAVCEDGVQEAPFRDLEEMIQAAYRWTGSSQFLFVRFRGQTKLDAAKAGRQ